MLDQIRCMFATFVYVATSNLSVVSAVVNHPFCAILCHGFRLQDAVHQCLVETSANVPLAYPQEKAQDDNFPIN